ATDFESAASTNSATGALPEADKNGSGLYGQGADRQLPYATVFAPSTKLSAVAMLLAHPAQWLRGLRRIH
ncbi:MAG: hypothetical protein ABWY13_20570, partial [Mesorhizobium sp.]